MIVFCLVFSFIYGAGAIFILTWNASVIATAMGNLIKSQLANITSVSSYFTIAAISFFRYMTHGIFEIAAYFIAGLAGGIISIAVIKHKLNNNKVIFDATELIVLSIAILAIASVIEVYVTPIFFNV